MDKEGGSGQAGAQPRRGEMEHPPGKQGEEQPDPRQPDPRRNDPTRNPDDPEKNDPTRREPSIDEPMGGEEGQVQDEEGQTQTPRREL
ncbi:MAG TPA: hypothetical protein VD772_03055, partial [Anseongella sp.]|nr:hypothetical protein [Anseongella sp.]